jgi:glycosyltransferase involved in cell wall biosynthesis
MKIIVIGVRGFPDVQGGIEKHCEEVYPNLSNNFDILVLTSIKPKYTTWNNINFKQIFTIRKKSLEKIIYAFISSLYCIIKRPDIVHVQGLNSALFIPLLKLFGLKVVYTQHSMDYLYPKWGGFAKAILLFSEYCGSKANYVTVVSPLIQKRFYEKYNKIVSISYNGVNFKKNSEYKIVNYSFDKKILKEKYILFVGRITPEKDLITLIEAFNSINESELYLVIVGGADYGDNYSKKVYSTALSNEKIIFTGVIENNELPILYRKARLFILPSIYESFGIVVLEAIYFKVSVLLSDIKSLQQFDFLGEHNYFKVGNSKDLANKILLHLNSPISDKEKSIYKKIVLERYDWKKTVAIFKDIYESF